MKTRFILFFGLLVSGGIMAQSCLPEGITFETQAQIDSFQINYPGCTEIEGDVVIGGEDISNLNGLSVLTYIGSGLVIRWNPALTSLTGLDNVISIGGYLWIGYNPLTNLMGLEGLTSIGGEVFISNSSALTSLIGLDNVTFIGGYLRIFANNALTSLTGLEGLTSIGGYLEIDNNSESLTSLTGLDNLTSIGGTLEIGGNYALTSLTGLESLTSIGRHLMICVNFVLTSLTGLVNVTSIGGTLEISYNIGLTSLAGLDNIESSTIEHLYIYENHSLSTCEILSICKYLAIPNGFINIHSNSPGCNSPGQVEQRCAEEFCLPEGITFETQSQIDSFQINYPNCTEIDGDVTINGIDVVNLNGLNGLNAIGGTLNLTDNFFLTDLSGLEGLISIGGDLIFYFNSDLTSITGLSNLTSLGGNFRMSYSQSLISLSGMEGLTTIGGGLFLGRNYSLSSLSGLDNLTSLGGKLQIFQNQPLTNLSGLESLTSINGGIAIGGNSDLQDLSGLDNLTSINGRMTIGGHPIYANSTLTNITALEDIDATTITGITISNNTVLSNCHIQNICDYLSVPSDSVIIHNNAVGCNSHEEVLDSCEAHAGIIDGLSIADKLNIYPNPTQSSLTIELPIQLYVNTSLTISNTNGQQLITQPITEPQTEIDISHFPTGIYIVKVWNDKEVMVRKVIKQ